MDHECVTCKIGWSVPTAFVLRFLREQPAKIDSLSCVVVSVCVPQPVPVLKSMIRLQDTIHGTKRRSHDTNSTYLIPANVLYTLSARQNTIIKSCFVRPFTHTATRNNSDEIRMNQAKQRPNRLLEQHGDLRKSKRRNSYHYNKSSKDAFRATADHQVHCTRRVGLAVMRADQDLANKHDEKFQVQTTKSRISQA
jgi:hypothetical protein